MRNEHATITRRGAVIQVTLDRKHKLNAIDDAIIETLWQAVSELSASDELRVLVISAAGDYFTAGVDLAGGLARRMRQPSANPDLTFRRVYRELHKLLDEFESVEKPVILAAQGPCLGLGVELAASCDFRFATTAASFGLPEVKLGVLAGSGGTSRITRLIGPHWAKWLAMAGQSIDADTALRIGLVHDVVAPSALDDRIDAFVDDLVAIPAECLGLAKLAVDMCVDADRTTQRNLERIANTTLFGSAEFNTRTERFSGSDGRRA